MRAGVEHISRRVHSNQAGPHQDLEQLVRKHLQTRFLRPIPDWVQRLADTLRVQAAERPWILDSGCGTGDSTRRLCGQYPNHFVVGIDQSESRLGRERAEPFPVNGVCVRADVQDLWRALNERGLQVQKHFLFYPNPWPKAHHLMRRWHGHPVWPALLALSQSMELRSNWPVYAQEFAQALQISGWSCTMNDVTDIHEPVSPFELKYLQSEHRCVRLVAVPLAAS